MAVAVNKSVFDDETNWFDCYFEDEEKDYSIMEHLLYGCYLEADEEGDVIEEIPYEVDEWLNLWREYVDLGKDNQEIWEFENKIKDWNEVDRILENLEIIKSEEEKLFEKLFTSNLVSCFLYEVAKLHKDEINERKVKYLAKWIQEHKVQEFSQDDFWRVVKKRGDSNLNPGLIFMDTTNQEYSRLWRVCCLKPIYISSQDEIVSKAVMYCLPAKNDIFAFSMKESVFEQMLDFCDGFMDDEKEQYQYLIHDILDSENREYLYKCLRKNFFTKKTAKSGIEKAMKKGQYDNIPMLMLQAHGEWTCKK